MKIIIANPNLISVLMQSDNYVAGGWMEGRKDITINGTRAIPLGKFLDYQVYEFCEYKQTIIIDEDTEDE